MSRKDNGFTVVELVSALAISMIISIAVVTVILGTLESTGKSQLNTATQAKVQVALNNFTINARNAETVYIADKHTLMFTYRMENRCELHTYKFAPDAINPGYLAFVHQISSAFVPGNVPCSELKSALIQKANTANTDRIEINRVNINSGFKYFSEAGQGIERPDSRLFDITTQNPLCKITSTNVTILSYALSEESEALVNNTTSVRFTNNSLGLSC
jgi:hypothetical protein